MKVCQSGSVWNGSTPQCLPGKDGQDGLQFFSIGSSHAWHIMLYFSPPIQVLQ